MDTSEEKHSTRAINVISVLVVLIVAILLSVPNKLDLGQWTKSLPHVIGTVNTITSVLLVAAFYFIKTNKIGLHRVAMLSAFSLGFVFLICYITYHLTNPANKYDGAGFWRGFYLFVLASHILLSIFVLPLVLRAMYFALTAQFARHKKIARYAFPTWLYVSVTGVIVYLMVN